MELANHPITVGISDDMLLTHTTTPSNADCDSVARLCTDFKHHAMKSVKCTSETLQISLHTIVHIGVASIYQILEWSCFLLRKARPLSGSVTAGNSPQTIRIIQKLTGLLGRGYVESVQKSAPWFHGRYMMLHGN
jgi:hypothetical protein